MPSSLVTVVHGMRRGQAVDLLLAILPEFGLRAFQEPSGVDFARLSSPRTLKQWERRETETPGNVI